MNRTMKRAALSVRSEGSAPYPSIVDTGAPWTFVPAHWLPRAVGGKPDSMAVGGTVYRGRRARVRVELPSGISRVVPEAFVAEHPRADFGLLGTDFLQPAACRVDRRRHRLVCPQGTEKLTELLPGNVAVTPATAPRRRPR
jgi:hypothetical protein